MSEDWVPLALDQPLFANLDPDAVIGFQTAIENGFINELGGHTRFPGLRDFALVDANAKRIYLHDFNEDLIAATDKGQVYRINRAGTVENITKAPVSGGRRVVFAKTDKELLMAAGGPILRFRDRTTEILSDDAPRASHVAWVDNYTVAVEINSNRWFHSRPGEPDVWDALDTFAADGSPDNINSLIVTPVREMLFGGATSVEQFERTASGETPFFRRWAIGSGVKLPYGFVFADNAPWAISQKSEWVRFAGQSAEPVSQPIGRLLESIDDWSEAWMGGYPDKPLQIMGQQFMLFQAPHATNAYGTKGITIVYDRRNKRFFELYGWDRPKGAPTRWPGWSHWPLWDKVFVGGDDGHVYEMTPDTHRLGSGLQRWLVRTSHTAIGNAGLVKAFRLRLTRGAGTPTVASTIRVRCSRDGRPFGPWITRSLGLAGQRLQYLDFGSFGTASTFQWELSSADDCAINLMGAGIKIDPVGH